MDGPDRKILAMTESQIIFLVACVASVSVGLSAGLKHFSLFELAKIGASAKKQNCLEQAEKPAETLATQAISREARPSSVVNKYFILPPFCA